MSATAVKRPYRVAMEDAEAWKPVVGYEGLYEVSSHGRVRRVARGRGARAGHLIAGSKPKNHYRKVGLYDGGGLRSKLYVCVYELVAAAFIGPRPAGKWPNHIDGNRHNDSAANLEYVTPAENCRHAYRLGLSHQKLTAAQAETIRTGESPRKLAREFGVSRETIHKIKRGESWRGVGGPMAQAGRR